MKTVKVRAGANGGYSAYIGSGLLFESGDRIAEALGVCRVMLVSDKQVFTLYGETVRRSLADAGFAVEVFTFPHGEDSKSMKTLGELLEALSASELTRGGLIVALGGGVTGDLAGFAAAVYLRGIRYVQIPTTLLAAVDSSAGGKTAVNLAHGKNLAGAFWQPSLVLCDCDAFDTLSPEDFSSGVAESLKYGVIVDRSLFENIAEGGFEHDREGIVERCLSIKAAVVGEDEFDRGRRQLLNFGHTCGHAIEKLSGYRFPHGHAVAVGMLVMTRAAERMSVCEAGCSTEIKAALSGASLPVKSPYSPDELAEAARGDKKRDGGAVTLILPETIGHCVLYPVEVERLRDIFAMGVEA